MPEAAKTLRAKPLDRHAVGQVSLLQTHGHNDKFAVILAGRPNQAARIAVYHR
jgi:hypothetical protein